MIVYATGPNKLLPYDIDGMENMARMAAIKSGKAVTRDMRSWYYLQSADPEIVNGLEKSFEYLADVLETQGPFDGIIGFSQGKYKFTLFVAINNQPPTSH
ncbi:Family of serine hydrolases 3 [Coemansia sp. RSA 2703]|nr:Family of serine hydrolases 3 [Coemansia sp. RSA 2703]